MTSKAPPTRRKFAGAGEEIDYLYHKLLFWLYDRKDARKALPFCHRLEQLLDKVSPDEETIRGEECRSLIAETKGDLSGALRHREHEVRLIERLHDLARKGQVREYVLRQYGYGDLSDRLDLLAILYHDSGDLDRALSTLHKSRHLCETHGAAFEGQALLDEYSKEKEQDGRTADGEMVPGRTKGSGR